MWRDNTCIQCGIVLTKIVNWDGRRDRRKGSDLKTESRIVSFERIRSQFLTERERERKKERKKERACLEEGRSCSFSPFSPLIDLHLDSITAVFAVTTLTKFVGIHLDPGTNPFHSLLNVY